MGKRVVLNSQFASVLMLIISLFLFVEALYVIRYVKESQSAEFEVTFYDNTTPIRILMDEEGYVLHPGESLVLSIGRSDEVVVEQEVAGRYTVRGGGKIVSVSIPHVKVSVK
ncbi:MAG: hypothetical protein JW697_01030 [Kosmotogaceae bacterium]|nr:hypothetical protein [Kosmotogaceae bacterium]